jgi:nitrite reductase/ring-hydroxylating ferredoxin subunit
VAVFNDNGKLYGIESDCRHMRASLVNGRVKNGVLRCKWHGWKYELSTGRCLNVEGVKLKRFEVTVDGEDVYLHYDKRI